MAIDMARTPQQAYWDEHSKSLKRIRNTLGEYEEHTPRRSKQSFQPLSDSHPLLQGSRRSSNSPPVVHRSPRVVANDSTRTPPLPRGRHSRTPPSRLPRMTTPPDHRHEAKVRGVHFDVLPNVRNQRNGYENGYDSWGDDAGSDTEEEYPYPSYPYPVVMYPMVLPGHHQRRRTKDKSKKKRVRYRNTPVLLNSRENTLHEPQQIHDFYSTYSYDNPDRYPYDTYDGGGPSDSPDFSYIATSHPQNQYDPFNPRMNPVLARYQVPVHVKERDYSPAPTLRRMSPDLIPTSFECLKYLEDNPLFTRVYIESVIQESILDDFIPEVLNEVIEEDPEERNVKRGPRRESPPSFNPDKGYHTNGNALGSFLTDLLDEVIEEDCDAVVKDTMLSMVDNHLEKAAVYDIAVDIVNEHIELVTEDIIADAMEEVFYERSIEELVIVPLLEEEARDIVTEVCDNYNNKKRRADLRQVKRDTGDKLLDSLCLDYILAMTSRQGKIWTEGEHANKLFDSVILNLILEQLSDVDKKRRSNVNAKPIRRHQEKMVTDVAVDVLLEELCKSLDEDMADLDEYEMGLENTSAKAKYSDLENMLAGL